MRILSDLTFVFVHVTQVFLRFLLAGIDAEEQKLLKKAAEKKRLAMELAMYGMKSMQHSTNNVKGEKEMQELINIHKDSTNYVKNMRRLSGIKPVRPPLVYAVASRFRYDTNSQ